MSKEELRKIPLKNYFILGGVILFTILILYYFYMWIDAYNETKLNKPILDKYMTVINYNELEDYLIENPDAIIYVSILEDEKIREFEKKIKLAFRKHEIEKDILYLDITEDIKNKDIKKNMVDKYTVGINNITDVPLIMLIDDGAVKNIYSINDNDYDINKFKAYLNDIRFSSEDDING